MSEVAVVLHRERTEAAHAAKVAAEWLANHGHGIRLSPGDAAATGLSQWAVEPGAMAPGAALALSLGGDGTMLRTVDLVAPHDVPVLGVNVGHLGYLTECEPDDLEAALQSFFAGAYTIEERLTLEVRAHTADGAQPATGWLALNDCWLEKTSPGHTVRLRVKIAGAPFTTYVADGLLLSTPTGSTAYNLSVRGPILSPSLRAVVLSPVSPHQLFDFPLVLAADETVEIEVLEGQPAALLVDGRVIGRLEAGDRVECRGGQHMARLVRFAARDFHAILRAKFGLTDR